MSRTADESLDALREAALDPLADEPAPAEEKARKARPVDAWIVALFPPGAAVTADTIGAATKAWREANDREVPSIDRLCAPGVVKRVDVDALSGYLAVVTDEDTWRAFVPREHVALLVALLVRKPVDEMRAELAKGPARVEHRDVKSDRPARNARASKSAPRDDDATPATDDAISEPAPET